MLAFGVKVLPIFIIVKKSIEYVCLDNLYLVKVSTANFKINSSADSKYILLSHLKNNANIN